MQLIVRLKPEKLLLFIYVQKLTTTLSLPSCADAQTDQWTVLNYQE